MSPPLGYTGGEVIFGMPLRCFAADRTSLRLPSGQDRLAFLPRVTFYSHGKLNVHDRHAAVDIIQRVLLPDVSAERALCLWSVNAGSPG